MTAPGLLVVWAGTVPVSRAVRRGADGLMFGGEHVDQTHGSVVRAGDNVAVVLDDVTPFERTVARIDGLASGARSADIHHAIEAAARTGTRVVIRGEGGSGRGHLAHAYAKWAAHPDTLVVENLGRMNEKAQREFLDQLQSLAAPAVFTVNVHNVPLPRPVADALTASARWFDLPPLRERPDELALIVYELVRDEAARAGLPELACDASLIEHCLRTSRDIGLLVDQVSQTARSLAQLGKTVVRAEDVQRAVKLRWAMHGQPNRDS